MKLEEEMTSKSSIHLDTKKYVNNEQFEDLFETLKETIILFGTP